MAGGEPNVVFMYRLFGYEEKKKPAVTGGRFQKKTDLSGLLTSVSSARNTWECD